jgi:hypothetical protein
MSFSSLMRQAAGCHVAHVPHACVSPVCAATGGTWPRRRHAEAALAQLAHLGAGGGQAVAPCAAGAAAGGGLAAAPAHLRGAGAPGAPQHPCFVTNGFGASSMLADLTTKSSEARRLRSLTSNLQHTGCRSRALWRSQVLMQMGPQLAAAASLPADISVESGRHGGLRSWTPEEALAEGVPPNHVPRSVRSPPLAYSLLTFDCQDYRQTVCLAHDCSVCAVHFTRGPEGCCKCECTQGQSRSHQPIQQARFRSRRWVICWHGLAATLDLEDRLIAQFTTPPDGPWAVPAPGCGQAGPGGDAGASETCQPHHKTTTVSGATHRPALHQVADKLDLVVTLEPSDFSLHWIFYPSSRHLDSATPCRWRTSWIWW